MTGCGICAGRLIEGALAEAVSCRRIFYPYLRSSSWLRCRKAWKCRTGLQEGKAWTGERADYIFSF